MNRNARLKITLLLLAWLAVFSPILPPMVSAWLNHSDNSHAILVPLISLYFIWGKREELVQIPLQYSRFGWIMLVASLAFYLLCYAGGIAVGARLMLVSSLVGMLWCCLGTAMVRAMSFPLGFLLFMVPVPEALLSLVAFPLQLVATKISANLIQLCSIPVYREGNMLYFLQTQLEVAEACSGIRSIISLIMLSAIFAYSCADSRWRQVLLVLSAIPIALVANIVRVSGTGILAHFFGDQVARGFLHEFSGLAVFAVGLLALFLEFKLLQQLGTGSAAREGSR